MALELSEGRASFPKLDPSVNSLGPETNALGPPVSRSGLGKLVASPSPCSKGQAASYIHLTPCARNGESPQT